jgi:hypothetical protein
MQHRSEEDITEFLQKAAFMSQKTPSAPSTDTGVSAKNPLTNRQPAKQAVVVEVHSTPRKRNVKRELDATPPVPKKSIKVEKHTSTSKVKVEKEATTPPGPKQQEADSMTTPAGVKLLARHFASRTVQRLRRRREALKPFLQSSRKPSQEDLDLPDAILREPKQKVEDKVADPKQDAQVACIMVRESQWGSMCETKLMLQTYEVKKLPQEFHVIVSQQHGSGSVLMGTCCVTETNKLKQMDINIMTGKIEQQHWKNRIRDGQAVYCWKLSDIVPKSDPIPLKLTYMKHRNRHFFMEKTQLDHGTQVGLPKMMSLYSTSNFFMQLLSKKDYSRLKETALTLNGYKVRVGTTCSGSDIGVVAVKSIIKEMNREFQARVESLHPSVYIIYI